MTKLYRSAKVLIIDSDNDVLVLRRSSTHPWSALAPDLPGGIIETDEELAVGAAREVFEETGLEIDADKLVVLHEMKNIKFHDVFINRVIYGVRLESVRPTVTISWEHDRFDWLKPEAIQGIEATNQAGLDYILAHHLLDNL